MTKEQMILNKSNLEKLYNHNKVSCDLSSDTCSTSCGTSCSTSLDLSNNYCKICDPKCKYLNCICADSWSSFDEIMNNIKIFSSPILLESLRISTITLCFNLNSNIDIKNLSKKYLSKNNGKFYNSIIFNWHTKYQNKTLVSVKIFLNGKVQVAGLSSIKSCAYIIRKVDNKCKDFYENKIDSKITNVKIAMINSDFKINNSVNLTKFCDLLSNYSIQTNGNFLSIVYQPIKYPAINSKFICDKYLQQYFEHNYKYGFKKKFNKSVSILIFRSGSIIITGGDDLNDYFNIYKYILNIIEKNKINLFI